MYTPYQVALCERIREHCRQRQCYGSDYGHLLLTSSHHTPLGFRPRPRWFDGFLEPPASDDQVREAEQGLGFGLPTTLRAVYMLLANGGFGPGFGILGLPSIVRTLTRGSWRLSQRAAQQLHQHRDVYLTCEDEPASLITLCVWDPFYGNYTKLDAASGQVYSVLEDVEAPEPTWDRAIAIVCEASSVEEWLERWLAGDLHPYGYDDADAINRDAVNKLVGWESEETDTDEAFEPSGEDLAWYEQHFAGNTPLSDG